MSKTIIKESVIATLTVLFFVPFINFFPFKFELTKPIKQEFLDFDIYDLKFSGNNINKSTKDTNIVLIEIAESRKEIADQIALVDSLGPTIIGVDVLFGAGGDSLSNYYLEKAISLVKSPIVFASQINADGENATVTRCYFQEKIFGFNDGYGNFIGDDFSVIRSWSPFAQVDDKKYLSFTTKILQLSSPKTFNALMRRDKEIELINFEGNLESFTTFSTDELYYYLNSGQLASKIKNKVVLLGFFKKMTPLILEDLHFTPVNEKVTGKSFPDMYGLVIHANILSMTLDGDYLQQLPKSGSYGIAALLTFCFMLFIVRQYNKSNHPPHLKILLLQTLLIIVLIYLFLLIFTYFNVKILLLPIILALVLCVEMFGIYKSVAKWLHKKFSYQTIFSSE